MTLPPLYAITDGGRLGEARLAAALERAVLGGLAMVQVREKALESRELARRIERLRERLGGAPLRWIVNRNPELVASLGLDGTHLGGDPATVARWRARLPAGRLIGYSAHTREELRAAFAAGADYASFSPVFAPSSKGAYGPPIGLEALREACREARGPVYALGGMRADRVPAVRAAGAAGVAAIGAILDAADPRDATRALLAAWGDSPAG